MRSLSIFAGVMLVVALTVSELGHAETPTQEGQLSSSSISKNSTVARGIYAGAQDRLQGLVDTLTTPIINVKEYTCLAQNIFFEAGNEPEEGKVAVGLVTINRSQDGRFRNTICGVVDQKVTRDISRQAEYTKKTFWGTKTETQTVWSKLSICQFSWRCMFVKNPKSEDERWIESQRVARELLTNQDSYENLRVKYEDALYFHATAVRPSWSKQKEVIGRIGGHYFYADNK